MIYLWFQIKNNNNDVRELKGLLTNCHHLYLHGRIFVKLFLNSFTVLVIIILQFVLKCLCFSRLIHSSNISSNSNYKE